MRLSLSTSMRSWQEVHDTLTNMPFSAVTLCSFRFVSHKLKQFLFFKAKRTKWEEEGEKKHNLWLCLSSRENMAPFPVLHQFLALFLRLLRPPLRVIFVRLHVTGEPCWFCFNSGPLIVRHGLFAVSNGLWTRSFTKLKLWLMNVKWK